MASERKPHVGFPEIAKHHYAKMLVDAGYKVVVVEQTERVAEQKERKESSNAGGPSCVEREACEVFTKGTVIDTEMLGGAGARFMVFLCFDVGMSGFNGSRSDTSFSACLVDCATSQVQVGRIADASDRNALRTLLAQVQPSEVVYAAQNVPSEVLGLLRRLPCRPQISPLHGNFNNVLAARSTLESYRTAHPGKLTVQVEALLANDGTALAVSGALRYLESVLLGQRVIPFAMWGTVDLPSALSQGGPAPTNVCKRMVLDATALSALEILETLEGSYKGSLLEFMDHTSTPFGFRLLKQWLCAPLYNADEICARHEGVEFFIANNDIAQKLTAGLKKIPVDLERATSRVWGYALQAERHAVMYEDVTARRLGDFMQLLQAYEQGFKALAMVPLGCDLPSRLKQITRTKAHGGGFPELQATIDRLGGSVISGKNPKNDKIKYRPRDGADKQYDALTNNIEQIKAKLGAELQSVQRQHPNIGLEFVHNAAFHYEIECDENALPESYLTRSVDITSRSKNKLRFQTLAIKELVSQLDNLQDQREDCVFPFLSRLFQEFYAHQAHFRAASRLLAELDALLSLAVASQGLSGASCRPEIISAHDENSTAVVELRGCRHPVAAAMMGASFVPNDTLLNAGGVAGVLVVTGPNMGGKSTVLRQTCIAVIMAQLGCRINAASCRLTPVDRIFTRIGSYDTILEGKSTLLMELEETATILAHGSKRSLAVLDELGRGTSTFDGAAIASAVLDELTHRVECLVLFATHYHPVSREAAQSHRVSPFHMAADVNEQTNEMTFLYRFLPGLCPASHGHNVAKLAGLPQRVLEEAIAKSAEFERGEAVVGTPAGECTVADRATSQSASTAAKIAQLAKEGNNDGLRALFRQLKQQQ